mmetsp:Transcript_11546/g.11561  ORF Transcript_11546/g.11561 Transcript_11546/m.11561 type:complete len:216 (+) Transcript_11546:125-772(+)
MSLNQVYIGNLDVDASVNDLHKDFDRYGRIRDIWVARKPPGFAFIEYEDERDASDAVQDMNGRWILDKRIRVEISRRGRPGERRNDVPRAPPRRTDYRVRVSGLSGSVGWRDLKDMLREVADPAFVDVFGNGDGIAEFFAESDVDRVIRKLDDTRFMGNYIRIREEGAGRERDREYDRGRGRGRDDGRDKERDHRSRSRSRSHSRSRSRDRSDKR